NRGRAKCVAIIGKRHLVNGALMRLNRFHLLQVLGRPEHDLSVLTRCGEGRSVRCERTTAYPALVFFECAAQVLIRNVPHHDFAVVTSSNQILSIRRNVDRPYISSRTGKRRNRLTGVHLIRTHKTRSIKQALPAPRDQLAFEKIERGYPALMRGERRWWHRC